MPVFENMSPMLTPFLKCIERPTTDELEEFIGEISMMKTVSRHPNVVSLLGCCTIRQPLLMIMEFVGCGDLVGCRLIQITKRRLQKQKNTPITRASKHVKTFFVWLMRMFARTFPVIVRFHTHVNRGVSHRIEDNSNSNTILGN